LQRIHGAVQPFQLPTSILIKGGYLLTSRALTGLLQMDQNQTATVRHFDDCFLLLEIFSQFFDFAKHLYFLSRSYPEQLQYSAFCFTHLHSGTALHQTMELT
jgi:hypothetical protein